MTVVLAYKRVVSVSEYNADIFDAPSVLCTLKVDLGLKSLVSFQVSSFILCTAWQILFSLLHKFHTIYTVTQNSSPPTFWLPDTSDLGHFGPKTFRIQTSQDTSDLWKKLPDTSDLGPSVIIYRIIIYRALCTCVFNPSSRYGVRVAAFIDTHRPTSCCAREYREKKVKSQSAIICFCYLE